MEQRGRSDLRGNQILMDSLAHQEGSRWEEGWLLFYALTLARAEESGRGRVGAPAVRGWWRRDDGSGGVRGGAQSVEEGGR